MSVDDIFAEFAETEEGKKEESKEEPTEKPAEPEQPAETEKAVEKPEKVEPKPEPEKEAEASDDFFGEAVEAPAKEEPKAEEKPTPKPAEEEKFDVSDAEGTGKIVITDYGLKGHGKTHLAFTLPGKIVCLSFDRKSLAVKKECFENDERITVKDAIRYLDKSSPEKYLESADKTFRYVNFLLAGEVKKLEPDWIMIDGTEILSRLCEMTMRYRNNLMPFQGIANRNLWKERRMYISQIHNLAIGIAKRGVIYTTYTAEHKIVKDGEVVTLENIPKWIDAVMYETDVVIYTKIEQGTDGKRRFFATVETSKSKRIPTGLKKDVTDVGMKALVGGGK